MKQIFRRITRSAFAAVILFTSASCASFGKDDGKTDDAAKREVATGVRLIEAYRANKSADFLKALPKDVKEKFGEREFKVTRGELTDSMGEIVSYDYLTQLNAPGFRTHIWKVVFERGETLDNTKRLRQETLFRIVTVTADKVSEPYIITFGFL